jgi:hypothetical protein
MKLLLWLTVLISLNPALGEEHKRPRIGIYMPKLDVYTQTPDVQERVLVYLRTTKPSEIPLAEEPIVSEDDVLSYDWATHTLKLRDSIWFKIREPGMHGLPFVMVVDNESVYVGAFWSPLSSISTHVPVILWDTERKAKEMTINWAYPTSDFGHGSDPRANERLKKALDELSKLKANTPPDKH